MTACVLESHYEAIIREKRGRQIMQEIQLLTREDIVEIVERELRGQLLALRDEMLGKIQESIVDAVKNHLPEMLETIVAEELKAFRQEILDALHEAVRQVTEERSFPGGSEDDYRQ